MAQDGRSEATIYDSVSLQISWHLRGARGSETFIIFATHILLVFDIDKNEIGADLTTHLGHVLLSIYRSLDSRRLPRCACSGGRCRRRGSQLLELFLFQLPLFGMHTLDVFFHLVFALERLSAFVTDEIFALRVPVEKIRKYFI